MEFREFVLKRCRDVSSHRRGHHLGRFCKVSDCWWSCRRDVSFEVLSLRDPVGSLVLDSSRTAVAPLERLKIVLQVQGNEKVYTGVWQVE